MWATRVHPISTGRAQLLSCAAEGGDVAFPSHVGVGLDYYVKGDSIEQAIALIESAPHPRRGSPRIRAGARPASAPGLAHTPAGRVAVCARVQALNCFAACISSYLEYLAVGTPTGPFRTYQAAPFRRGEESRSCCLGAAVEPR